ncbi:MAG TPA: hypothetical protein VEO36_13000, partial [Casimicrobiaceae bacterium]|nr:hypothetical protein [Casimicrobiaceae bacterium]
MIELVAGRSALPQYPQAEGAGRGRTRGIHDFGPIAMPLYECIVEHRAVGYTDASIAFGMNFTARQTTLLNHHRPAIRF